MKKETRKFMISLASKIHEEAEKHVAGGKFITNDNFTKQVFYDEVEQIILNEINETGEDVFKIIISDSYFNRYSLHNSKFSRGIFEHSRLHTGDYTTHVVSVDDMIKRKSLGIYFLRAFQTLLYNKKIKKILVQNAANSIVLWVYNSLSYKEKIIIANRIFPSILKYNNLKKLFVTYIDLKTAKKIFNEQDDRAKALLIEKFSVGPFINYINEVKPIVFNYITRIMVEEADIEQFDYKEVLQQADEVLSKDKFNYSAVQIRSSILRRLNKDEIVFHINSNVEDILKNMSKADIVKW